MKSLNDVIYEIGFGNPSEQTLNDAREYLRDYNDLLLYLKVVDKNWEYIRNKYSIGGQI